MIPEFTQPVRIAYGMPDRFDLLLSDGLRYAARGRHDDDVEEGVASSAEYERAATPRLFIADLPVEHLPVAGTEQLYRRLRQDVIALEMKGLHDSSLYARCIVRTSLDYRLVLVGIACRRIAGKPARLTHARAPLQDLAAAIVTDGTPAQRAQLEAHLRRSEHPELLAQANQLAMAAIVQACPRTTVQDSPRPIVRTSL